MSNSVLAVQDRFIPFITGLSTKLSGVKGINLGIAETATG